MWSASAILVNQPNGYAEMGTFTAATQWRTAIGFIPGVLAQFALPLLSNLNGERDVLRYAKALRWNLLLAGAIAFAIAGPVALFASKIMALYGREFHHGSTLLVLSAVVAVVTCVNSVVGTAIVSAGSMWAGCAFNAMWALAFLIACHQLIPKHLALGLTLSLLLAYLAHTVWQAIYLRRTLVDPRVV
jgi:O-antigen/teichoic acid export membrane protein